MAQNVSNSRHNQAIYSWDGGWFQLLDLGVVYIDVAFEHKDGLQLKGRGETFRKSVKT